MTHRLAPSLIAELESASTESGVPRWIIIEQALALHLAALRRTAEASLD